MDVTWDTGRQSVKYDGWYIRLMDCPLFYKEKRTIEELLVDSPSSVNGWYVGMAHDTLSLECADEFNADSIIDLLLHQNQCIKTN